LYAGREFRAALWRVQSSLACQDVPGEFPAFFIISWRHRMLRWRISSAIELLSAELGTLLDELWITSEVCARAVSDCG
jgi:hypothetical protein